MRHEDIFDEPFYAYLYEKDGREQSNTLSMLSGWDFAYCPEVKCKDTENVEGALAVDLKDKNGYVQEACTGTETQEQLCEDTREGLLSFMLASKVCGCFGHKICTTCVFPNYKIYYDLGHKWHPTAAEIVGTSFTRGGDNLVKLTFNTSDSADAVIGKFSPSLSGNYGAKIRSLHIDSLEKFNTTYLAGGDDPQSPAQLNSYKNKAIGPFNNLAYKWCKYHISQRYKHGVSRHTCKSGRGYCSPLTLNGKIGDHLKRTFTYLHPLEQEDIKTWLCNAADPLNTNVTFDDKYARMGVEFTTLELTRMGAFDECGCFNRDLYPEFTATYMSMGNPAPCFWQSCGAGSQDAYHVPKAILDSDCDLQVCQISNNFTNIGLIDIEEFKTTVQNCTIEDASEKNENSPHTLMADGVNRVCKETLCDPLTDSFCFANLEECSNYGNITGFRVSSDCDLVDCDPQAENTCFWSRNTCLEMKNPDITYQVSPSGGCVSSGSEDCDPETIGCYQSLFSCLRSNNPEKFAYRCRAGQCIPVCADVTDAEECKGCDPDTQEDCHRDEFSCSNGCEPLPGGGDGSGGGGGGGSGGGGGGGGGLAGLKWYVWAAIGGVLLLSVGIYAAYRVKKSRNAAKNPPAKTNKVVDGLNKLLAMIKRG